jgi:biotin transport system substrate-specific component
MSSVIASPRRLVLADLIPGGRVRDLSLVAGGAALTGLAAQVSIHTPLSPVPFTLQTLTVLLVGASLGSVRGAVSMLVYLAAGAAGVPWYSNGSHGWGGPTFGYVVGFVAAAGVVGYLAERRADRHIVSTTLLIVLGNVVVYAFGATWLGLDLHLSVSKAFALGVRPFLVTDIIKIALAALALPAAWKLTRES